MFRFSLKCFLRIFLVSSIVVLLICYTFGVLRYRNEKDIGNNEIIFINTPHKSRCNESRALIIIKCRLKEFEERRQIRKTWGKTVVELGMTYVFSLGTDMLAGNQPVEEDVDEVLRKEIDTNGDILQSNVPDDYHLLALKAYVSYYFVVRRCDKARYLLFVDCDVIVFPHNLATYIDQHATRNNNTIYGFCYNELSPVRRDPKVKGFIPKSIWRDDTYPPFCSGSAYLMASPVAKSILYSTPGGVDNWRWALKMDLLDDVMFTGYLRQSAGVQLTVARDRFRVSFLDPYDFSKNLCQQQNDIVSIHGFRPISKYQECWTEFATTFHECKANSSYLSDSHCYKKLTVD